MKDNSLSCLSAMGMMGSGALMLLLSAGVFRGQGLAPIGALSGVGVFAGGVAIARKYDPTPGDYAASIGDVYSLTTAMIMEALQNEAQELKQIQIPFLPEPIQSTFSQLADRIAGDDWMPGFIKRSHIVVGPSKSGKTQYLLHLVSTSVEALEPGGRLLICDIDYGSSHEDSEPNYWFHLPRDRFIVTSYEEIYDQLLCFFGEMERRSAASHENANVAKPLWRLIIDEWIGFIGWVYATKETKVAEDLVVKVGQLLQRGLKQRVVIVLGCQNLYTNSTRLPQALIPEFNLLLLGSGALDRKNLGYLKYGDLDEAQLRERVKSIRKVPGCKFAAIAQYANEDACIKVVPFLDVDGIEITMPDAADDENPFKLDPIDEWYTSLDEKLMEEFTNSAFAHGMAIAQGTQTSKDSKLAEYAKTLKVEQRNKLKDGSPNDKYIRLKNEWNAIVEQGKASVASDATPVEVSTISQELVTL